MTRRGAQAGKGWPTRWIVPPSFSGTGRLEGRERPCDAALLLLLLLPDGRGAEELEAAWDVMLVVMKERRGLVRRWAGWWLYAKDATPSDAALVMLHLLLKSLFPE